MTPHAPYSLFPVLNCGIDWLTVSSTYKGVSNPLEQFGYEVLLEKFPGEGQRSPGKRLGYVGHQAEGVFCGRSPQGVLLQLSGPLCTPLAAKAITHGTSVSRIDTQVTVWTEGEQPHLARWTFNLMRQARSGDGRPGTLRITEGHPDGETLNVNQRVSESFGRLYDKTAEAKLGAPRLLWRYEVEWKGSRARWVVRELARHEWHPTACCSLVHAFYSKRGVQPAFEPASSQNAFEPMIASGSRDVLTWMAQSLSITVAKAVKHHGAPAVLSALGLTKLMQEAQSNGGR